MSKESQSLTDRAGALAASLTGMSLDELGRKPRLKSACIADDVREEGGAVVMVTVQVYRNEKAFKSR